MSSSGTVFSVLIICVILYYLQLVFGSFFFVFSIFIRPDFNIYFIAHAFYKLCHKVCGVMICLCLYYINSTIIFFFNRIIFSVMTRGIICL